MSYNSQAIGIAILSAVVTISMLVENKKKKKNYQMEDERRRKIEENRNMSKNQNTKVESNEKDNLKMLDELKNRGVLSTEEYNEKIKKVQNKINAGNKYKDIEALEELAKRGILSREELETKRNAILKDSCFEKGELNGTSAFINIIRPDCLPGRLSKYTVVLDGKEAGRISNDSNLRLEVEPGQHNIYVESFGVFTDRIQFELFSGEEVKIKCTTNVSTIYLEVLPKY